MAITAATANKKLPQGASNHSFALRVSVRLVATALACFATTTQATEWRVTPHLDFSETYTDNVMLAPPDRAQSDWITQFNPGVSIEGKGADLRVNVDYTLQNLIYANDSSRNDFHHRLDANANATLVDNTLFLDASANIFQDTGSLLGRQSYDNLNPVNVSDVYTFSISPYLLHKFGSVAVGQLRYTHDEVREGYGSLNVKGLNDSSGDLIDLSLNGGASFSDLGWGITYTNEKVDYNYRADVNTQELTGTASYPVLPKLRAVATAGYEKNDYIYLGGQEPSGSFWSAGLSWTPTTQTSVNGSFGEHYFGNTYAFALNHRTAQATWLANYTQEVTSTRQEFLNPYIQLAAYILQLTSTAAGKPISYQDALQQTKDEAIAIGYPTRATTNAYYLSKRLLGGVSVERRRSLFTLTLAHSVREAVEESRIANAVLTYEDNVKEYGLDAAWTVRMSPRDTFNVSPGFTRNVFPDLSRTDDYAFLMLGMTRKLERSLTGSLDYRYTSKMTSNNLGEYTENAITGRLSWRW